MKWIVSAVIATAFAGTAFFLLRSPSALPDARSGANADGAQLARLSTQVEVLQRQLDAVESQLITRAQVPATGQGAADASRPAQSTDVEQERAQEAEKHHEFIAGIAQRFAGQRVDPIWANRASSRLEAVFGNDEALHDVSRNVECREQICRVEIEDDGTDRFNRRIPFIAMGLADVLPNISAERIDRGNGRGTMVLYMSSQSLVQAAPPGR